MWLIALVEAAGFVHVQVVLARGYWSHGHQDVVRWTAHAEAVTHVKPREGDCDIQRLWVGDQ